MDQKTEKKTSKYLQIALAVVTLAALVFGGMAFSSNVALADTETPQGDTPPDKGILPLFDGGRRDKPGFEAELNYDEFLADELDITVAELNTAMQAARQAMLQAAVDKGLITEEQYEMMQARAALAKYIDREALTAKALGISVEEMQTAREQGKSLRDLLDEQNMDMLDFRNNLEAAYQEAVQQAVKDGVITQEQAEQFLQVDFGRNLFPRADRFDGRRPRSDGAPAG